MKICYYRPVPNIYDSIHFPVTEYKIWIEPPQGGFFFEKMWYNKKKGAVIMKKLFCIIGPSGSGKSTYVRYAKKYNHFGEIISTTTRTPRPGEVDGRDYHFVSLKQFDSIPMIEVDEYAGNKYGTAQRDLENAYSENDSAFMVITYEGAQSFKKLFQEENLDIQVITIFIYTPIEELEKRMIKRGDDLNKVNERINNIRKRQEYQNKTKTDYVFEDDAHQSIEENCQRFVEFIQQI